MLGTVADLTVDLNGDNATQGSCHACGPVSRLPGKPPK